MTGKPINLRQARKARDRAAKRSTADANAALHSRPKADRLAEARDMARATKTLDGHKVDKE
ncbi:MAG: DUF4169 family protein [Pseudomonadota bacterium]